MKTLAEEKQLEKVRQELVEARRELRDAYDDNAALNRDKTALESLRRALKEVL